MNPIENVVFLGDCFDILKTIPDKSVGMILTDPPYRTTQCSWDTDFDLEMMWAEFTRVTIPGRAIVITSVQPFTTRLIASNYPLFQYDLIWKKHKPSNFAQAQNRPMKYHEIMCIFGTGQLLYNPQMVERKSNRIRDNKSYECTRTSSIVTNPNSKKNVIKFRDYNPDYKLPTSVIEIPQVQPNSKEKEPHPTQKPVALFEYLIKTYTNPGDLILDPFAGSGTTAVSCLNTTRKFAVIEREERYVKMILKRVRKFHHDTIKFAYKKTDTWTRFRYQNCLKKFLKHPNP